MNDDLILENMNLVYYILQHDYPAYAHDEDLIQCGLMGLVEAARNFNPDKGQFKSYARKCIHGTIKKELSYRNRNAALSLEQMIEERGYDKW